MNPEALIAEAATPAAAPAAEAAYAWDSAPVSSQNPKKGQQGKSQSEGLHIGSG